MSIHDVMQDAGLTPVDWSALEQVKPAKPVIPGLLNEGESGSLIGQGEVGKSLLILDIAVGLALGSPVLGAAAAKPMTVMYIDMENPEAELADRLRHMGLAPAELNSHPLHYFSFPDLPPLDTTEGGPSWPWSANFTNRA